MIQSEQYPFNDKERAELHAWLNSPARYLYQKMLTCQAAEKMVQAETMRVIDEQGAKEEADLLTIQARVFTAASAFFNQCLAKDSPCVYLVRLTPQPPARS